MAALSLVGKQQMGKKISLTLAVIALSGCSSFSAPEQRVASWEDWELCHRLADFVYKSESKWLWYATTQIAKRGLDQDQKCKSIYDARMHIYVRNKEKSDISISFGEAIKGSSFEEVTK